MKFAPRTLFPIWLSIAILAAQETPTQGRVAAIRQSIAENQIKLHRYDWLETTEVSIKGELRNRRQAQCRYGADGKLAKTPVGTPAAAPKPRGLRGKIAAGKIEEMHNYTERLTSLIRRYLPPDAESLQAAFKSGKASLDKPSGELVFTNYAKSGDKVTYSADPSTGKLGGIKVDTYLDSPQDTVKVEVSFTSLPDGTNTLSQSVVEAQAKHIQVKTTHSDYSKISP